MSPALTTVDQQAVELGKRAVELLFARLRGEKPLTVVLPPQLIERESLAARR
jgi:DNA-binding LacI/PurR family transcriptional regulator